MSRVVIGLGSNIGDRLRQMRSAVEHLMQTPVPILKNVKTSPVYESPALLKAGAPKDWDQPFYNAAVSGETDLAPGELLVELKLIEERIGREYRGEWSPREIDLDILVWEGQVLDSPTLCIPHNELLRRDFALVPLADVEPGFVWPRKDAHTGKTVAALVKELGMTGNGSLVRTRHHLHTHA